MNFRLYNEGSIVMVEPLDDEARAFVDECVDVPDWAWLGNRFACEPRLIGQLVDGIMQRGGEVVPQ